MMTKDEYELLTDSWSDPKGAAYNQVYEFCKAFGWLKGYDTEGNAVLTDKGKKDVRKYEESC